MPRPRPRSTRIETKAARLRLEVRGKPHDYTSVTPGVTLGYRRNKRLPGVWVMQASSHGGTWIRNVGHADDVEDADGERILSFHQACDRARKLARGGDGAGQPADVAAAIADYEASLKARDGELNNVSRVRFHLTPALAAKPVGLLIARELTTWRNGLLAKGLKSATVLRTSKVLAAALNHAARLDPRITNHSAWKVGLGGLTDTFTARNAVFSNGNIIALTMAAHELDDRFGLYVEVHAVAGARSSQIAALTVGDLQVDRAVLMVPASRKGSSRRGGQRTPVPITRSLADKLAATIDGRPPSAPLLVRRDGRPWQPQHGDHSRLFAAAAERVGLQGCTIYSLRHSSITRSLLAGTPTRVVAALHDTSIIQIEKSYSAYIADFSDQVARRGLLEIAS